MKQKKGRMKKQTQRLAAVLIIAGVLATYWFSAWFLLVPLFVGLNMLQFSYTNWCLVEQLMKNKWK